MYSRVKRILPGPGPRGDLVALLRELCEARERAANTYDMSLEDFLPTDFWSRVADALTADAQQRGRPT